MVNYFYHYIYINVGQHKLLTNLFNKLDLKNLNLKLNQLDEYLNEFLLLSKYHIYIENQLHICMSI